MDRLQAMAVFRRVVERGSFSGAARDMNLSNAAVSKLVSALETDLGARLIARTTRRLALTDAGRQFLDRLAPALDALDEAARAVKDLDQSPRGRLKVSAPMMFGAVHLTPLVTRFMAQCPDLSVDLLLDDRAVDLVQEGIDVAIRGRGSLPDSSLTARRLTPLRRLVAASPDYLKAHGRPRHPDDLAGRECLIYLYATHPDEWVFVKAGQEVRVGVGGRLRATTSYALLQAALAGHGLINAPTFYVGEHVAAGRLVQVLTDWQVPDQSFFALWPGGRQPSAKVRAFVDFLAQELSPEPPWDCWRAAGKGKRT